MSVWSTVRGRARFTCNRFRFSGGVAIYSGILPGHDNCCFPEAKPSARFYRHFGRGYLRVILVGTLDDRGMLHHQIKLFGAMPVAGLILLASDIHAQVFSTFLPGRAGLLADAALTVFWVTGITASIPASSTTWTASVRASPRLPPSSSPFLAAMDGQVLVSTLAAAVTGAALGFLRWNFNPAKIFMGDGGAMLLGFPRWPHWLYKLRLTNASRGAGWIVPILVLERLDI